MRSITSVAPAKTRRRSSASPGDPWVEQELAASRFKDVRLAKRLHKLVAMMAGRIGQSVPSACQDWANSLTLLRQ